MADEKPRVRVQAGSQQIGMGSSAIAPRKAVFDAGKSARRLKGLPTASTEINRLIRTYGKTVLARSRYLAANNPYAAQAKEVFVSALVGSGIKPSSLMPDAETKQATQELWNDFTDEADADGLTDFYGLQATIASEMFEAGECFIRIRPRFIEDGLAVPFQLQVLPSEMLPIGDNRDLGAAGRVVMGIQFDAIGRRVAYHFLRQHPGSDQSTFGKAGETTMVPANEVIHLFKPVNYAGQIRGIPHTLSALVTAAILDAYDDAELERKRVAALFGGFITRAPGEDDSAHALKDGIEDANEENGSAPPDSLIAMEPGAFVDLEQGQDVTFSEPADVGGNYEAFQYRALLRMAAGFGVPYAAMTGDLRQTTYGSIRAGLIEFRRRIEAMQHHVMVFQFCRPVWRRFMDDAVMTSAVEIPLASYQAAARVWRRVKWMTPRWEWIDPLKDLQAELLAVQAGFKARSDTIEAQGYDPEETDQRIANDKAREERLGLNFVEGQFAAAMIGGNNKDDPNGA